MKTLQWSTILGGVIAALIAAFVLDWWRRRGNIVNANAQQNAWVNSLTKVDPPSYANAPGRVYPCQGFGLNANPGLYGNPPAAIMDGPVAASAHGTGAPTPTYRNVLQIGVTSVPAQ